ncbi:cyclic nucleotide-binding domain-containing protein [Hoeflea sp. TYP-13]|uniref:cyclic nucleotide-binding domain-containing protein n=1 Tax=Hoeflea sp. TYP-13 TaxID=3230023 RepID=UPI0034C69234
MEIEGLTKFIAGHPLFKGLDAGFLELVTGCAKNARFEAGVYLAHEGDAADVLYLIRHGEVGLSVATPGQGNLSFLTVGPGESVGLSWLFPPYRWTYDARAINLVRAIAIDAACLRNKCENDHHLGYEVMKRLVPVLVDRLHATRLQLLDVYGNHG